MQREKRETQLAVHDLCRCWSFEPLLTSAVAKVISSRDRSVCVLVCWEDWNDWGSASHHGAKPLSLPSSLPPSWRSVTSLHCPLIWRPVCQRQARFLGSQKVCDFKWKTSPAASFIYERGRRVFRSEWRRGIIALRLGVVLEACRKNKTHVFE